MVHPRWFLLVAAPSSGGTAPGNSAREVTQIRGKDGTWPGAEQTWDQTEVRGWHKSSGKLHPFPFQCWVSSAIDLQVSARRTCLGTIKGISFSSREGVRPGGPAPKRDAGNTYGKAEKGTTQTLRSPKEVKRGQTVFRGMGWETRGCIQMDQILL